MESENIKITKKLAEVESDSKEKLTKEKDANKAKVLNFNSEIKKVEKDNEQLQAQITLLTTQKNTFEKNYKIDIEDYQKELKSCQKRNSLLTEEVNSMQLTNAKLTAQVTQIPNIITKHNEQINQLHEQISRESRF